MHGYKRNLVYSTDIPHCAPSDDFEVRRFVCLPDYVSTGVKCTANELCPGIESL
jgi:hypothetical protein